MAGFGGIFVLVPFQSASIVVASGRKLFLVPLQSASIAAASGGKLFGSISVSIYCGRIWQEINFWFLLSQRLLCPHLAGSFVFGSFSVSFH